MATPARFLFDTDFSRPEPPPAAQPAEPPRPTIDLDQHLAEMVAVEERARAEGFDEGREEGFAAGRLDAEARAAERLADAAQSLVGVARSLLAALDADRLAIEARALDLAVIAAEKLAGRLVEREPLVEIRALLTECLGPLRKAPHLVVRLDARDADALEPEVARIARETGFEGRIVILGEDDLARGDCRIEWADGGILRDRAALSAEIEAAVDRWITARRGELDRDDAAGEMPADPWRTAP
ncbi:MAG: flagellar assembly protein FliH [Hyphomicrobiales bacterium]|nr:flagellar assembly protein FliH [Hyphomicrobiales bacterium]